MRHWRILLAGLAISSSPALPAMGAPVVFISIDGLRPVDVLEARQRNLKLPNLQRFVKEGSWAKGVQGVLPTITYPSHTTLVTGVAPARHGIYGNTTFDPMQVNYGGWYWYSSDITHETLWDAAKQAGLTTANVHWPVSVGQESITWNLPQIWRSGHEDDAKLISALATPGLVHELEQDGSHYAAGIDESISGDENRAQFAVKLMDQHHPDFMTVYLTALDHEQHVAGPDSPSSRQVLERIDALVGQLVTAAQKAHPDVVIAVASDHGFAAIDTEVNLYRAFIDEGLITLDAQGKIQSWKAVPWPSGGSAAIVLNAPQDAALTAQVAALLARLQAMQELKISRILDQAAISKWGANPQAQFYVAFKPGVTAGQFKGSAAPLVSTPVYRGMHGYMPDEPTMYSSFFIMGSGIAKNRNLGVIDMRSIAPTIANLMNTKLDNADLPALSR